MAFGALVDTSFLTHDGDTCRLLLEQGGYSSTTYSPRPDGYTIEPGDAADDVLTPRVSMAGITRFYVENATLMQLIRSIPGSGPREYRLTIEKGGTQQFIGYAVPSATSAPRADNPSAYVTIRAKDRLRALSEDWTDASNVAFPLDQTRTLAVAVTSILGRLNLGLPLEMVMDWRPESMGAADDPGSIQVPNSAFYRDGQDDTLRPMSAGAVLDDLLGTCNAVLVQRAGTWRMQQPASFASGSTVDVWQYDTSGTLTGQTTRPATVDVTQDPWEKRSDDVRGRPPVIDARVTYEHGAPDEVSFDGGMEDLPSGTWDFYTNGGSNQVSLGGKFKELDATTPALVNSGDHSLQIEGEQTADAATPLASFRNFATRYGVADMGPLSAGAEKMQLTLTVKGRLTDSSGGDATATPDASRVFWAFGGPAPSGATFWYVEGTGWKKAANMTTHEHKNTFLDSDVNRSAFESATKAIPAPPEGIDAELRVYDPVARPKSDSSSDTDFVLYGIWDALVFERQADEDASTIYRAYNTALSEGDTFTRTVRVGTGPWKGSPGALLDDAGAQAQGWSVLGQSQKTSLSMLAAEEALRLRSGPQEANILTLTRPSNVPLSDRAVTYDGTRYWPLMISERQETGTEGGFYEITVVELKDTLPASIARTIASGSSETFEAPTRAPKSGALRTRGDIVQKLGTDPADQRAIDILVVDASGGNASESLPDPADSLLLVVRPDGTSNTAEVTHTSNIVRPDVASLSGALALKPYESHLLIPESSQWHVAGYDKPVYTASPFFVGLPQAGATVVRSKVDHDFVLERVDLDVETAPADGNAVFSVSWSATDITLTQGATSTSQTYNQTISAGTILKVTAPDPADSAMQDLTFTFAFHRPQSE